MCRALLYLGEPVVLDNLLFQPDSALVRQSYMPKMLNLLNLAGFGLRAVWPAATLARTLFRTERARGLFAGLAAHASLCFRHVQSGVYPAISDRSPSA